MMSTTRFDVVNLMVLQGYRSIPSFSLLLSVGGIMTYILDAKINW